MTCYRLVALVLCAVTLAHFAAPAAAAERSRTVARQYERLHPCPDTGRPTGPCPGWVIDHIVPLCAGGPDSVGNMQWQSLAASKIKDKAERAQCRRHRAATQDQR